MVLFTIFLVACLSVWLAYINYVARIEKGRSVVEANPIWSFFDERGFEKIQFILVPVIVVSIGSYYVYTGNEYGVGVLTGFVFLNALVDAMSLHRVRYFEGTAKEKYAAKTGLDVDLLKKSFGSALLGSFVLVLLLFLGIVVLGLAIAAPYKVFTTVSGIAIVVGTVLFIGVVSILVDLRRLLLFENDDTFEVDEGLPLKTELSGCNV